MLVSNGPLIQNNKSDFAEGISFLSGRIFYLHITAPHATHLLPPYLNKYLLHLSLIGTY